jgi:hypothetical protein
MAPRIEVLRAYRLAPRTKIFMERLVNVLHHQNYKVVESTRYVGGQDYLILYGVGAPLHALARDRQIRNGGKAVLWDLGYTRLDEEVRYLRFSVNHDHPQKLLDQVEVDGGRWNQLGVELKEGCDPEGPIILVGLGMKSRTYLCGYWEQTTFSALKSRFPKRRIIYRPKRFDDPMILPCERNSDKPIAELLQGASLVVCRHSNVAVDAVIAGVPFEAEDGAAMWLKGKPFTRENRLEFLHRLAWFQWRTEEVSMAWDFAKGLT